MPAPGGGASLQGPLRSVVGGAHWCWDWPAGPATLVPCAASAPYAGPCARAAGQPWFQRAAGAPSSSGRGGSTPAATRASRVNRPAKLRRQQAGEEDSEVFGFDFNNGLPASLPGAPQLPAGSPRAPARQTGSQPGPAERPGPLGAPPEGDPAAAGPRPFQAARRVRGQPPEPPPGGWDRVGDDSTTVGGRGGARRSGRAWLCVAVRGWAGWGDVVDCAHRRLVERVWGDRDWKGV
jgi:hypothetical protein